VAVVNGRLALGVLSALRRAGKFRVQMARFTSLMREALFDGSQ